MNSLYFLSVINVHYTCDDSNTKIILGTEKSDKHRIYF